MADETTRLLRLPEVRRLTGLGRSTIYERISAGLFPAPIRLGGNLVAWNSREVDAWIETQIAQAERSRRAPLPVTTTTAEVG